MIDAIGSLARFLEVIYFTSEVQMITPNGLAVLAGGATPQDMNGILRIVEHRKEDKRARRGWFPSWGIVHPNSPLVKARILGEGAYPGNRSRQDVALERLQTDLILREELNKLVNDTANAIKRHRCSNFTGIHLRGFGGSDPWAEYFGRKLRATVKENWEVEVRFIPAADELMNRKNARGSLYKIISEPVPENKLIVVKQQQCRGPSEDDPALAVGLMALVSSAYASNNPDAATLFEILRHDCCGWVEARPAVVSVPLGIVDTSFLFWHRTHQVKPPEADSPGLRMILTTIRRLIASDPQAVHAVVLAGNFQLDESRLVRDAVLRMGQPGKIVCVLATMQARVKGNSAQYLICDFTSARQLPTPVTTLFSDSSVIPTRGGLDPGEFLRNIQPPEEVKIAQEIEKQLGWLVPRCN